MSEQTPTVGSVWGVPSEPRTWRLVESVHNEPGGCVQFMEAFGVVADTDTDLECWYAWVRAIGAIDLTAALASAAPQVQGETVRVRACVGHDGDVSYVYGGRIDEQSDADLAATVRRGWGVKPKHRRGYAVIDKWGALAVNTVRHTADMAWACAESWFEQPRARMKECGYRCVRVEVREIVK